MRKKINFHGYIISSSGIKPEPDTIKNFKEPRNVRDLQAFLDFVNFYTKLVNNYSKHTISLVKLLKKGQKYEWLDEQQKAFDDIENLYDENIILKFDDIKKPFTLTINASDFAIVAVLSQLNENNEEEVIPFISRILKCSEMFLLYHRKGNVGRCMGSAQTQYVFEGGSQNYRMYRSRGFDVSIKL